MTLIRSFGYAFQGIWASIRGRNMRIHLAFFIAVITTIVYYGIHGTDLAILVICLVMVPAAEMFNTAIESLCDLVTENPHPQVKFIKDVAAGGVLTLAIGAAVTGVVIIAPYVI